VASRLSGGRNSERGFDSRAGLETILWELFSSDERGYRHFGDSAAGVRKGFRRGQEMKERGGVAG